MDNDDQSGLLSTRALTVKTGVTRVEFDEFKEGRALYCKATQETMIAKIDSLKNLFIGSLGVSTTIIAIWMYLLDAGHV